MGIGSKRWIWAGRVISALPAILMLSSGVNIAIKSPPVMEGFARLGYPETVAPVIGVVAFVSAALYAIPATSVLGAILLTGYLGGATASHLRIGDPFFPPVIVGVVVWAGLFLRDARLRALISFRRLRLITKQR
ncbi:MAG: DoxX family protein [Bryobacteraceae bacterium]|nr:DoxX family protein [Bryobacteraceae bacterium]